MRSSAARPEPGFTLVEVMVVIALSAVVTMGIVSFYLSAQQTWTDASSQALAQRDGSTILEAITRRGRGAASAEIVPNASDSTNSTLILYDGASNELARFFWDERDSLVHYGTGGVLDQGPVAQTRVIRFACSRDNLGLGVVSVDSLRLLAAGGQMVVSSSSFGLHNRP